MILNTCLIASFFIAITAISTGARAEKIYQCGSTYSQLPCKDATVLNIDDSRDSIQKSQSDEATRRGAELARRMEQERLAQEQKALAAQVRSSPAATLPSHPEIQVQGAPLVKIKRIKPKGKKLEVFIAEIPGPEKKPAKKKTVKKRKETSPA